MAMDGLFALVLAGAVVGAGPNGPGSGTSIPDHDSAVATTLAVQTALREGRDCLLRGDFRAAVNALEGQLAYINGNQVYLKVLQDAYRGYVKELRLAKQDAEAQKYLRRLLILDRGAILESGLSGEAAGRGGAPQATLNAQAKPAATARGKSAEDPFDAANTRDKPKSPVQALLERADQSFWGQHYREARALYEQAHQTDDAATNACRERWAYCKLWCVVDQMNQSAGDVTSWPDLEREVRLALDLAPRLDYGKKVLDEIEKRRSSRTQVREAKDQDAVPVRHGTPAEGWSVAESANFRIFHTQSQEQAERTAAVAERTRAAMQLKWFGGAGDAWSPKCDLYLHATADDYSRATGVRNSPGHSSIRVENGRVVVRRIDLHCDEPNMLIAVLPHETTHVVLAGEFGQQLVPRWADEGMAVLTEPRDKVERHLTNLAKCRQENRLFRLQDLMQLDDYPRNATYVGPFYAQSVSLVEFLSRQQGPQEFTRFLHDGMRYGYDKALERHYGFHGFSDLEQRWSQYAFQTGVAAGYR
jgi:tetratricopeptide (TPR) repeat protein